MNKKGIERNIVVLLFVLVLVVFSFAERDSRKLEKLYTTSQHLNNGSLNSPDIAAQEPKNIDPNN